jgi:hypothetical protein
MSSGYQYGPTAQQDYSYGNYMPAPMWVPSEGGHMSKSIGLRDLFDIALTTLAFLSFGMFIIQVIMCILMAKHDNSVMLPMEMTANGAEVETAELEVRVKRAIDNFDPNIKRANEIAKLALRSIDGFIIARDDGGVCLKNFICENNKFSRRMKDLQRYLIPMFGLGLSWISNRRNDVPMISNLDFLQASIIGLGGGKCNERYKCDYHFLEAKRK